jgi:hypothetical protein
MNVSSMLVSTAVTLPLKLQEDMHSHCVYDVKHNGHHKAHLIGDGLLTDIPVESIYSGVVSLHGL